MTPALSGILNINPHARSRERQSQTAGGSKKIAVPQVDWTSDEKEGRKEGIGWNNNPPPPPLTDRHTRTT